MVYVFVQLILKKNLSFYIQQVKVITDKELLASACEQFLGKDVHEIEGILLQTLEGHLRAILGKFLLSYKC